MTHTREMRRGEAAAWLSTVGLFLFGGGVVERAGGRDQPARGPGRLVVQAMRQSLRRLCVAQMSFHSVSTGGRPRWETVRIPRLCLI